MSSFKKVLFMIKNYDAYGSSRPPLGLGYLSESLKCNGIDYEIVDMNLIKSFNDISKKIEEYNPDLIGVSIFTIGHIQNFNLIQSLKKKNPFLKFIVGGPHISVMKDNVLRENNSIDFAIVNEGEDALVQLCTGVELKNIKKIVYRENGGVVFNEITGIPDKFISDLDNIPWPKYEKFQLDKYINELFIITSRGCPYQCMFCAVRDTMGRKVRVRSIPNVLEELTYWYKKGRRIFNFVEDNLTFYYDRVFELCDEIQRAGLKGLTLRASNGIRADRTDRKMLKRMKEIGFKSIAIAVEGGNEKMMKILKKGETLERVEQCIKDALDLNYEVSLTFVYGAPGETTEDIKDLIALAKKYPVFKADIYNLVPYPATPLWKWVSDNNAWTVKNPLELLSKQDKNLRFTDVSGYPFFETKELSFQERIALGKQLRDVTIEIQRNAFVRKFRAFGPFDIIIANILSTKIFNRIIFNNNFIRKLSERIRFILPN